MRPLQPGKLAKFAWQTTRIAMPSPSIAMTPTARPPQLEITGSRQLPEWMAGQGVSIAFTTYQTGKLFLVGLQPDGRLSIFERTLNRAMGLYATDQSLYLSSLYQLWRFENALEAGQTYQGYDRLYVPQVGYTTGDLDIHDIVLADFPLADFPLAGSSLAEAATSQPGFSNNSSTVPQPRQIIFVNTLFSCLATPSETHSFVPLWQPPFLSRLAAEDRCHLNGLAVQDGVPRYVTAVSQSDVVDGWRDRRHNGGCVIDIAQNQVIATGLSMPHSPRCYQGQLWVLNSGTGYLGSVEPRTGQFTPLTFCPGYLRGLAFTENFAIVGLSRPRQQTTLAGLALEENLKDRDAEPRCGLMIIDLNTGDVVHWLRIEGIVEELYDVALLPGVRRPMAIGFVSDEIRRMITMGEPAQAAKRRR